MQIGDVVVLKSGGPAMTVARLDIGTTNGSLVTCVWFTRPVVDSSVYGELHTSSFALDTLTKVNPV